MRKYKKKLSLAYTSFLGFCVLALGMMSFYPSNSNAGKKKYKTKISYDLKTITEHAIVEEGQEKHLTQIDLVEMRREEEIRHVEKYIDNNDDMVTEITHTKPSNLLEPWMPKIAKTVIDKEGVRQYDAKGKLLNFLPVGQKLKARNKKVKQSGRANFGKLQEFRKPLKSDLDILRQQGLNVEELSNGKLKFEGMDNHITFDDTEKSIEKIWFKNGKFKESEKEFFHNVGNGKVIPKRTIHKATKRSHKGTNLEKHTHKIYSNYSINDEIVAILSQDEKEGIKRVIPETTEDIIELKLFPNPVENILNVELPYSEKKTTLSIIDIQGQMLDSKEVTKRTKTSFNTAHLPTGIYILKIETSDKVKAKRFVKN